jgi:hypothetical protein
MELTSWARSLPWSTPRRENQEQGAPEDPRRRTSVGSVDRLVTGLTSVAAGVETAEEEIEEETTTDTEKTRGIAADRLPGTDVDAAEVIRERLRDVKDAASDASREDTSRLTAPREAAAVVHKEIQTLEIQETIVTVVTDAEKTEVDMVVEETVVETVAETLLAATITREVALLPVNAEAPGSMTAHPLVTERTTVLETTIQGTIGTTGTGVLPNTVVTIATTAEAPRATTSERKGRMHTSTKIVGY